MKTKKKETTRQIVEKAAQTNSEKIPRQQVEKY